jgi:flagellar export protein FliJ
MAKFRFSLQSVLEMRQREERELMVAVAEIERDRRQLEDALRECQGRVQAAKSDIREQLTPVEGGIGAARQAEARWTAHAAQRSEVYAHQLVIKLSGVHRRLNEAKGRLSAAAAARRAVEVLRERRYEEWKRDRLRRESVELDEMASVRSIVRTEDEETAC